MAALKAASDSNNYASYESTYGPIDAVFKDGRFSKFIGKVAGYSDTAPLYEEALRYAGYPLVEVMNGVVNAALQDFIDEVVTEGTNIFNSGLINEYEPFDLAGSVSSNGRGETLLLTLPVVFTGTCDATKFLKGMPYIGLSNLLVTRIWQGVNNGYDAGDAAVSVTGSPSACSFPDFNSPAPGTNSAGDFVFVKGEGAAIEGLIRPPTKGEEEEVGIRKIYLVE
jgi:hypothetical protein